MTKRKMVHRTGAQVINQILQSTRAWEVLARETTAMLQALDYRYDEHTGQWTRVRAGKIETISMEV